MIIAAFSKACIWARNPAFRLYSAPLKAFQHSRGLVFASLLSRCHLCFNSL